MKSETETRQVPVGEVLPANARSSGRYRLLGQHLYAGDRLLEAGEEVGTDTPFPWPDPPSPLMVGVDDAGKAAVKKLHNDLYGRDPPWIYNDDHPEYKIHEERRKEQEKETESVPVSHAQAMEREKEWKGPVPPAPGTTRMISGSRTAVAMPPVKVGNPNEELYPKG